MVFLQRLGSLVRRHKKRIVIIAGVVIIPAIIVQLLYPGDQTVPRAVLGNQAVGG